MSYTYHGTSNLIALPNRTVQTYPSGLVRVERSFVCRKDRVAKFRNTIRVNELMPFDNGAPAIDGLYIFPEPQEVVRDDGFVEFRVTAYGRTNVFSQAVIEKSSIKSEYFIIDSTQEGAPTIISFPSINDVFILRGVVPSSTSTENFLYRPSVSDISVIPLGNFFFDDVGAKLIAGSTTISRPEPAVTTITRIALGLDSYTSTNFGLFSEYTITWRAGASINRFLTNNVI